MKKAIAGFLLVIFFLGGCYRDDAQFREYVKMDNMNWNRFDILMFEVPVQANDILDFNLFLRHHTHFPYDKLFINITFYSPDGDMRSNDYTFDLKDYRGDWLAEGMGDMWDLELPIRQGMPFYQDGICKVRVETKYTK